MAGAYAAVVSVMTVMDNLKLHPRPPLSLDPQQAESLTQHLTFFEEFLEKYDQTLPYSTEADPFESRIADAAYAAEDAIESHIVDRLESHAPVADSLKLHPHAPLSVTQQEDFFERMPFTREFFENFMECYNLPNPYPTEADPSGSRIADAIESHIADGECSRAAEDAMEGQDLFFHTLGPGKGIISSHAKAIEADAAYAAEDAIEFHIVDPITSSDEEDNISSDGSLHGAIQELCVSGSSSVAEKSSKDLFCARGEGLSSSSYDASLYEALENVIQEMESIQKEAMEIKQTKAVGVQHQPMPLNSLRSSKVGEKRSMVGVDDLLLQMKEWLVSDNRGDLQAIPIVGMGGAGKTTLALNIYQDRLIKDHFDVRAWATISQEYNTREILAEVHKELKLGGDKHSSEESLGEILYKHLFGRRYLIVMDDMWNIGAWDGIRRFLPDSGNGSKIVVTTRLSDLASKLSNSNSLKMKFLDETDSWDLLSKTVFGEEGCPPELEEIGKEISKSCKGLPLSIIVIGGFLATSTHTVEFWEDIKQNLSLTATLEDYERCLEILYMSYKQLPIYLKPCYLYLGVYPEDNVSSLVNLWVAEGFLKPASGESTLEEIAKLYLKDLADRNLILIDELDINMNIKLYKIHDLLRDLCLREAEKERFYTLTCMVHGQRRIVIKNTASKNELINALPSMSLVRSLFWNLKDEELEISACNLRLLRIFHSSVYTYPRYFVNSRFLEFSIDSIESEFSLSISRFWNLQTLIADSPPYVEFDAPIDIWYMPHIRHLVFTRGIHLPDPPKDQDDIVLGNLQTLKKAINFKCSDQMVTRIPNLKKLNICYNGDSLDEGFLSNLNGLKKLESLACSFYHGMSSSGMASLSGHINFPHSLKKLSLDTIGSRCWEQELLDKIGSLPFLQKLQLISGRFEDGQWETSEGQFRSLKVLYLDSCKNLQVWIIESSHFPCLSHLHLESVEILEELPLEFAEVSTLRLIEVYDCTDSTVVSLKSILEENEDLYGEPDLQIQITLCRNTEEIPESKTALEELITPNFCIEWEEEPEWDRIGA